MSAQCPKSPPKTVSQPTGHGNPTKVARRPFLWAGKGRSREGETYRAVVRALTRQIGGEPSPAQALSIGQLGWLQVHLAKLNEAALTPDGLTEGRLDQMMELHRLFARGLRELGMKEPPAEKPDWNTFLGSLGAPQDGDEA